MVNVYYSASSFHRGVMSRYDVELTADQKRLQARRRARFPQIVERLDLIPFDEIADWCARKPGSVERHEELRNQAYRDLKQSILRGEFGPVQKPTIAYLPRIPLADYPGRLTLRLTGGQLLALGDLAVTDLWAPRRLCIRWLTEHQIPLPPRLMAFPREADWRPPLVVEIVDVVQAEKLIVRATDQEIDDAILAVYREAAESRSKPPNVKQLVRPVKLVLKKNNKDSTQERIIRRADDPRFAMMRRRPGRTLRSEIRKDRTTE
jgi:hypothetical protein